jgi:hypothetical protein
LRTTAKLVRLVMPAVMIIRKVAVMIRRPQTKEMVEVLPKAHD